MMVWNEVLLFRDAGRNLLKGVLNHRVGISRGVFSKASFPGITVPERDPHFSSGMQANPLKEVFSQGSQSTWGGSLVLREFRLMVAMVTQRGLTPPFCKIMGPRGTYMGALHPNPKLFANLCKCFTMKLNLSRSL